MRAALATIVLLSVSACAETGPRSAEGPSGPSIETLTAQCQERGGMLAPSGGPLTGRPALDYSCRITPAAPNRTQ